MLNKSLTATLTYAITSSIKMGLIAKLVRGKNVDDALNILNHVQKTGAKILYKVVHSAMANATNNAGLGREQLFVERVDVGKGPKIKRMRIVSRGRPHGYLRHRSFVRVVLNSK